MLAEEYVPTTYTIVAYYNKNMEPRKISRFQDHAKAILKIKQSLLSGQHADIIAENVSIKDVKKMMADFALDFSIPTHTKAIPSPKIALVPRAVKKDRVHTRYETREGFDYEIRRTKCTFQPGFK